MKKLVLLFFFFGLFNHSQITDISDSDWYRSGNFLLKELAKGKNSDVKGSPYLNNKYENGKIMFSNGNTYSAAIRLNIGNQKFEIQNKNTKEIVELNLDETAKVLLSGRTYSTHSLNINGSRIIALLDECNIEGDYKLYYYAKKNIEIPKKMNTPAPASGFEKSELPEWKDFSSYYISYNGNYYQLPTSHKKMSSMKIFTDIDYKNYRKKNKLNLKDRESLIAFVNYLNNNK